MAHAARRGCSYLGTQLVGTTRTAWKGRDVGFLQILSASCHLLVLLLSLVWLPWGPHTMELGGNSGLQSRV